MHPPVTSFLNECSQDSFQVSTMTTPAGTKDVQSWLQSLNLGEYVNTFHNSGYFVLRDCVSLTDGELHALGIHQTGYKKRILNSISSMDKTVGKPNLPPRVPPSGMDTPQSPKPHVPARKPPRPPSLDNEEYYKVEAAENGIQNDQKPKPSIVPRASIHTSTRPTLPPRREKPRPQPRAKPPGEQKVDAGNQSPPVLGRAVLGKIPSGSSSDEEDLSVRPLPPVPGKADGAPDEGGSDSTTEFIYDLPEPPLPPPPPSLEPVQEFVPPLPKRPPVIGAEAPPRLPERPAPESIHSTSPSQLDMALPPPPPMPSGRPFSPPSSQSLPPPPPTIPDRPHPDPVLHPHELPGQVPALPTRYPPPPERPGSSTPPALPQRPSPPAAVPTSMVPQIPARPIIPYISDDTAKPPPSSESLGPSDGDPYHLIDRPVPIPPPILPESDIAGKYDLDRPVPLPPPLVEDNDYQEYGDEKTDGGEHEDSPPIPLHSPPAYNQEGEWEDNVAYGQVPLNPGIVNAEEPQGQTLYDVPKPLGPPESFHDTPTPPGDEPASVYSVPPPPRRQEQADKSEGRDSIYDTPSSNQRASTSSEENLLDLKGPERSELAPPPPRSAAHSFTAPDQQNIPPGYTNVSSKARAASLRGSRSSDVFSDEGDSKEYIDLASTYSGQLPAELPPPRPFTPSPPTTPVPPPRSRGTKKGTSDYIYLSDTTSKGSDDFNANSNHEGGNGAALHYQGGGVSYTRPLKTPQSPTKPARPAPPPPPPRQSSLSDIPSPKKSQSTPEGDFVMVEDNDDDTYHLVDSSGGPKQDQSSDYSTDDDLEDSLMGPSQQDQQRLKALNRISDCTMGLGDQLTRQENLRKSYKEMRRSMHQKTLQKVSATYSQLPPNLIETNSQGQESGLEKSGYLNLYTQSGSQANRGQKRRYVVFTKNELRYYASERELNASKGIVPLGTMRDVKYNTNSKEKNFKLDLHTNGRILHFGTENLEECIKWASTLMQAILSYTPPPGGFPIGGDMSSPDKQGYLKMDGVSSKRYIAIKGEKLCMYKSSNDFDAAVAICDIEMKLANVREVPRKGLQLTTPSTQYFLNADSPIETSQWRGAMEEAIQEGLSSHEFLEVIWQNESNKFCAECSMKDPDWASINLGIVVCKACSGGHRFLGVHISKVRSLKMDERIWTEELLRMMVEVGNNNSNAFWESKLSEDDEEKLHPGDTFEDRQAFIKAKYQEYKYCDRITAEKSFLTRTLHNAVDSGSLRECIKLLFSGADPLFKDDSGRTALDMAKSRQFVAIHELLKQNCDVNGHGAPTPAARTLPSVPESPRSPTPPPVKETSQESIKISGYLQKTGSNRKDFQRRYCVLEHGVFKYYADEKAQAPKSQIEGSEMILIAVAEPKPNHLFCFDLCASSGRAYLFDAESEEERQRWMLALAKCQTLERMWDRLQSYDFAGFLKKKEGAASTQWQRLWFILQGKFMYYFSAIKGEEDFIDLRKLKSLSMDDSKGESEEQMKISFVMPKKNLYFTTETEEARELWYKKFEEAFNSAGTSLEDQPLSESDVPLIITACINFVEDNEGLNFEGVYRKSGAASAIRQITALFQENPRGVSHALKDGEFCVPDVTGALKKYFRELPDPMLTNELYPQWIRASAEEHDIRLNWYKDLLENLPHTNHAVLKDLICHLRKVDANQERNHMHATNLGTVFGPTLMANSDPQSSNFQNAEKEISVIKDLITYFNWLFDISTEESEDEAKRRKEEAALKKLDELNKLQADTGFIVEIFIGRKPQKGDGTSFNIKISQSTTAEQLIAKGISQGKVQYSHNLALFEIVCRGDMERLIHSYEYVLQDIMGWNNDFGKDSGNYMCIMEDYLTPRIELYMRVLSSSDFVKFQEGRKSFKKMYFELNQNVLNAYKDRQAPSATYQWKVSDMKIYLGHDKKRAPPTQHCLAFITPKEQGFRQLSFDTEEALNTWLGALFKSKSLDQSSLPIPSSTFNTPFTRPQETRDGPNALRQLTSHLKRWSRNPAGQGGVE